VRTALDECVYLVPNKTEGLRGARLDRPWMPASSLNDPPALLEETGHAVRRDTAISAAVERVGRRVGAWGDSSLPEVVQPDPQLRAALDRIPKSRPEHPASPAQNATGEKGAQRTPGPAPAASDPRRRWLPVVDSITTRLAADPNWPALAATLELAQATGMDVRRLLPHLAATQPLPEQHPALELQYRVIAAFPSIAPELTEPFALPTDQPPRPAGHHPPEAPPTRPRREAPAR